MKKVLLPLAGMPNQRDMDSLQSLIEGKDQRFRSVYIIPIDNPITGQRKLYVEKRPGFEQANIGDCLGEISPGCTPTAIHFSRATGKYITAFCGTDIYVNCDSVGATDEGTPGLVCNPVLQCEFDGDSEADVSGNSATATLNGPPTISGGFISFDTSNLAAINLTYTNGALNGQNDEPYQVEFYAKVAAGAVGRADYFLFRWTETPSINGYDTRLAFVAATNSANYRKIYHRNGNLAIPFQYSSATIAVDTWTHVCYMVDFESGSGTGTLRMFFDGVKVLETSTGLSQAPAANGNAVFGHPTTYSAVVSDFVQIDDLRISTCLQYSIDGFTPPARGSLLGP
jgi:hypothetical protein